MKILLLGSGGREHALAWKIAQSKKCEKLFIAPGNAGTTDCGENVAIGVNDFEKLKAFAVTDASNPLNIRKINPIQARCPHCSHFHHRTVEGWRSARRQ